MRAKLVLIPIAFAALLVSTAAARSTSGAGGVRTLRTATAVDGLAADGSRVAVSTACRAHVYELFAWNPLRRSVVSMAPRRQRKCFGASTGEGIWEQSIAGRQLAWVPFAGGNDREQWLVTATTGSPRSTTRLVKERIHSTDGVVGDWVGNVYGDGRLVVFNTWSVCDTDSNSYDCPEGTPPGLHIYNENLWRIVDRHKRLLLASPDELTVLSVAAGRILVQRAEGSLELRRGTDGSLVRSFPFGPDEVQGAVLDSAELVVLHRSQQRHLTWRVIDPVSGAERVLNAQAGATPADVERGLLVYTYARAVYVLRLADGDRRRFTTPRGSYPYAQIEPSGLFYSYSVKREGRVRFVPFHQIGLG